MKLKHEIEIQDTTIDLLHNMKLDDLLNCNNNNCIYLPYWIKIFYSKENKLIKISCYVFWFKYEENIKNELQEKLSCAIDEPILYNIVEETKNIIDKSLSDKIMLNNLLTEIGGELMAMKVHKTTDNFLLFQTGVNEDIKEDFEFDEIRLHHHSNNNKKNKNKKNEKTKTHEIKNTYYISILNKIRHKPIIIEFIFSFIKNNPLQIFKIIEIDKRLKNTINSFFISSKKINDLSKTLNNNITIIQIFKLYQDILLADNICYQNIFDENTTKNNSFPSFIDFKTQYILKKWTEDNKAKSIHDNIRKICDLNNIHYQLIKNIKNIHLTYLPKINNQTNKIYYDGSYIEENIIINKNTLKQEIDVLYCIIDDNEYFKYVKPIKDNIIINNIYFIFVKGNKNINIYDAMIIYLNKINVNTIKEIYLGIGFFQEEIEKCFYELKDYFSYKIPIMNFINEDVFILKKKFKLSKNIIIKTN